MGRGMLTAVTERQGQEAVADVIDDLAPLRESHPLIERHGLEQGAHCERRPQGGGRAPHHGSTINRKGPQQGECLDQTPGQSIPREHEGGHRCHVVGPAPPDVAHDDELLDRA